MFYGILSIIIGIIIYYAILNIGQEKKSNPIDRLTRIKKGISLEDAKEKNLDDFMKDTEYKVQIIGEFFSRFNFFIEIRKQLKIADINLTADVFIMLSIIPAIFILIIGILVQSSIHFFLIAAVLAAVFPFFMLKLKIKKRYNLFTSQFPDTLDLISSSLKAGHSLLSALQLVSKEAPDPVGQIFKIVSDDISLGRDTREALDNMTETMPMSIDLRFFVTAVLIQREIGGNLAEILDSLNYTIRERFKLLGQIETQTAQAKLSGIILAIAPFIIAGIISVLNPAYLTPLIKTFPGQVALGMALLLAGIGYMIINKITDIRV